MNRNKILIIDDEDEFLEIMDFALSKHGYEVVTASTGKNGIEKSLTEKPFLILLDMIIPDMNGWKVLKELENNSATQGLPVIIISGVQPDLHMKKMISDNVIKYHLKPFNFNSLLKTINNLANKFDRNFVNNGRKQYLKQLEL